MDASVSSPKDQRSSFMRRRGMVLFAAVIVVMAILIVVVATHHSSPKPHTVIYDQNGHVISSPPVKLTYVYSTNRKVVAVKCTHANGEIEHAATPYEIKSLIHFCSVSSSK